MNKRVPLLYPADESISRRSHLYPTLQSYFDTVARQIVWVGETEYLAEGATRRVAGMLFCKAVCKLPAVVELLKKSPDFRSLAMVETGICRSKVDRELDPTPTFESMN
jgi:hypothetical protein